MTGGVEAAPPRRAPRLSAHEWLAPYITRRGRFVERDPLIARRLPSRAKVLGVAGWASLTGYAVWRAVREQR